ncbi:MAG: Holliday junction branch migration protein RuvA, partial [Candidatus Paceibacterota bacterium]
MISYLKGKVIAKNKDTVTLDVQGVGYKVFLTERNLDKIESGQELEVFCFLDARERALELYGFLKKKELELFKELKGISGVGSKVALKISALGSLEDIKEDIENKNTQAFEQIKGVGKKRAQKIILELTGKIEEESQAKSVNEKNVQALVNLGFSKKRSKETLKEVSADNDEEKVKKALEKLGK